MEMAMQAKCSNSDYRKQEADTKSRNVWILTTDRKKHQQTILTLLTENSKQKP